MTIPDGWYSISDRRAFDIRDELMQLMKNRTVAAGNASPPPSARSSEVEAFVIATSLLFSGSKSGLANVTGVLA